MKEVILFALLMCVSSLYLIEFRKPANITEMSLLERDYLIFEGQSLCFKYSGGNESTIYLNDNLLFNTSNKSICLDNVSIGESKIRINSDERFLSFVFRKMNYPCSETKKQEVVLSIPKTIEQYESFDVNVSFTNSVCKGHVYFLNLFVDGKHVKSIPVKVGPLETKSFSEAMRITDYGTHNLRAEIANESIEREIFVRNRELHFPIGLILFAFFAFILFRKGFNLEFLSLLFAASLALLVILPFVFDKLGTEIFFPTLAASILIVILCLRI
ncbi:MAG: hypothetical protein QXQ40_00840 [Candidatus Aenigmatarchaeota archaeon]